MKEPMIAPMKGPMFVPMKPLWILLLVAALAAAWGKEPYTAIVRQVAGDVRTVGILGNDGGDNSEAAGEATGVKVGDLPAQGQTFVTGRDGLLVVRFHPDFMRIEARAHTRYRLAYPSADSNQERNITLEQGLLVLGVGKRSPPLKIEDAHSTASAGASRFSFAADADASTLIVLDGAVTVHNNASDETGTVKRRQKAVSDANGLRISDASTADLQQVGLRQSTIEIDFVNPTTEESSTLEMEYENNF